MTRTTIALLVLGSLGCGSTPAPVTPARTPRPVTAPARIRFEAEDPVPPPLGVQSLSNGWIAEGLPAISADENSLAIVEIGGNGITDYGTLLILSALDASIVQRVPLFAWSAADDVDDESYPAFVASLPSTMTHAGELLIRGDYHALVPIPDGDESAAAGPIVLRFTDDGVVTLRDASDGRLRFEGRVIPMRSEAVETAEEDSEDSDYEEDEGEDPCADRSLEMASASSIDAGRVLLHTATNSAADECYAEHAYRIVELIP